MLGLFPASTLEQSTEEFGLSASSSASSLRHKKGQTNKQTNKRAGENGAEDDDKPQLAAEHAPLPHLCRQTHKTPPLNAEQPPAANMVETMLAFSAW